MNRALFSVFFTVNLCACVDQWCNATEVDGEVSVRKHYVNGLDIKCVDDLGDKTLLFPVDSLPSSQDEVRTVMATGPMLVLEVGNHPFEPGAYVQCFSLQGPCNGLDALGGLIAVTFTRGLEVGVCSSRDTVTYGAIGGPVERLEAP